jgi:hypothetical protein
MGCRGVDPVAVTSNDSASFNRHSDRGQVLLADDRPAL